MKCAANARLIAAAPDLLEAIVVVYSNLADVNCQWPGRETLAGQRLLLDLRDSIALATGDDAKVVQDKYQGGNHV